MQKLNHPNIVKYIDTIRSPASKHLYIILEYMEQGSLAHVLKRFGAMSESLAAVYISQVLQGLEYLHDQGVLHRDIKGANVLTNKEGVAKLCDFGVATELATQQFSLPEQEAASAGWAKHVNDVLGTPYWMGALLVLAFLSPLHDDLFLSLPPPHPSLIRSPRGY
jgi:serine/threonine protein kinase